MVFVPVNSHCSNLVEYLSTVPIVCVCVCGREGGVICTCLEDPCLDLCGYSLAVPIYCI